MITFIRILKWRLFKYVFNAVITKIYGKIVVSSDHTRFQRTLFRDNEGKLCVYEHNLLLSALTVHPFSP